MFFENTVFLTKYSNVHILKDSSLCPSVLNGKSNPITGLDKPRRFQEVEAPRFQDNRHMKVVIMSALRAGRLYPQQIFRYSFLLEAESTPGP
jgi:hypothetical protein